MRFRRFVRKRGRDFCQTVINFQDRGVYLDFHFFFSMMAGNPIWQEWTNVRASAHVGYFVAWLFLPWDPRHWYFEMAYIGPFGSRNNPTSEPESSGRPPEIDWGEPQHRLEIRGRPDDPGSDNHGS